MSKLKCKCGKTATWLYMPSSKIWVCCDNCVPRGCSCNTKIDDSGEEPIFLDEQEIDDQGRLLPCCEWFYEKDGFDK